LYSVREYFQIDRRSGRCHTNKTVFTTNSNVIYLSREMDFLRRMREEWNRWAHANTFGAIDSEARDEKEFWRRGETIALWILDDTKPKTDAKILDLGCGIGRIARPLLKWGYKVHGIDVSSTMISLAQKCNSNLPNHKFKTCNGKSIPFPSSYFDLVYSVLVFQHLPLSVMRAYISEIRRVLKTRGKFWVQVPRTPPFKLRRWHFPLVLLAPTLHSSFSESRRKMISLTRYYSVKKIRFELENAGLKPVKLRKMMPAFGNLWLCITAERTSRETDTDQQWKAKRSYPV